MSRYSRFPLLLAVLAVGGCSTAADLPALHSVKGQVLKNGKPVQGGHVQFAPQDTQAALLVSGPVGADGTFTLTTHKGKESAPGAPEGKYQAVYSPPPPTDTSDPVKAKSVKPVVCEEIFFVQPKENNFTLKVGKAKK